MLANHKILFDKINVRGMELKNRFAMAPMGPLGLGDANGGFNQRGIDYYTERAKGGTGLIITGVTFADNDGGRARHAQLPLRHLQPRRSLCAPPGR